MHLNIASSRYGSKCGANLAAEINLKGKTLSTLIDCKELAIKFLSTLTSCILRKLRNKAKAPSFFSPSKRSQLSFLSAPEERATSHVSGTGNSLLISCFHNSDCSASLALA